ncbi:MAG TPA: vanadium-dependent haloperoxidase [Longimicrobium sp.]|nr:vanadium-dependent haloperoxidase [Longimicrobium sp.]
MPQLPRREEERRLAAREIRDKATTIAANRPRPVDDSNGDEVRWPTKPFVGNYSKGLNHDAVGDPDPQSYGTMLRAIQTRDPLDFEQIVLGTLPAGTKRMKLTNPQSGYAFNLEGPDSQEVTMPPAPTFDSEVEAHEMGELYWMAVARDVPFIDYAAQAGVAGSVIQRAIASLGSEFPKFGGTVPVTAQNLFRGIFPGEQAGPYVSQFLLKGNSDPRKMDGGGRNADEGYVAYGSQVIDQRQQTVRGRPELGAAADYLTDHPTWLQAQNGADFRGQDQFDFTQRRFIRSLRDGANYVHFDLVINAFYNAAWILASEPTGTQNVASAGAVPMRDREFPLDAGNPYATPAPDSPTEVGFVTFGDVHLIEVLTEVIGRAGRAVWWQKWGVHRRLRPEEFGGRIDNWIVGRRDYAIHASIKNSLMTGGLSPYFGGQAGDWFPSYLLPQAYPEGAPTHPAYGAGHATISGACITILKAFFDESKTIENPMQANADGTALVPWSGGTLTVLGELNKLAGNIAIFRNAAGVHWRSDYTQSLLFGEAIAIKLLQELSITFNEDEAFFELTKLNGQKIRIRDGFVDLVASAGTLTLPQPLHDEGLAPTSDPVLNPTTPPPPQQSFEAPADEEVLL